MKPSRSPRFQSAADRCNIAAISRDGSPRGTDGAPQAAATRTVTTHDARRTVFLLLNVAAGAPRRDAPADIGPSLLTAAFLLGRFFLLLRGLPLLRFRTRFLGGFLFLLPGLRLGRGARLFHWHGRGGRGRGRRGEHGLHEPRSRTPALREVHLLTHRISPMLCRCGAAARGGGGAACV